MGDVVDDDVGDSVGDSDGVGGNIEDGVDGGVGDNVGGNTVDVVGCGVFSLLFESTSASTSLFSSQINLILQSGGADDLNCSNVCLLWALSLFVSFL